MSQGAFRTDLRDPGAGWAAGPLEAPVGWLLVVGGLCAGITWAGVALLGGWFVHLSGREAFEAGVQHGALMALLPLLSVGSVLIGVGLLRRGRFEIDVRLLLAVYGTATVGALSAGHWGVAAVCAVLLGLLLLLRRMRWGLGA
jgi:hypothetical protein